VFNKDRWVRFFPVRCLGLSIFAIGVMGGFCFPAQPIELHYRVRLARPTTHLIEVEIDASKVQEPALDFVMPAWSPGRYAIYDFAKNVQEFEALNSGGQTLPWKKLDKQTWHVETRDAGAVRVRYKVFANDLNGTFSQFDSSHANLNGASVYMYVAGHKADGLTLAVEPPPAWKVFSGFSISADERSFQSPNYDRLIDMPMEISAECVVEQFRENSKMFRVVVHDYGTEEESKSSGTASSSNAAIDLSAVAKTGRLPYPESRIPDSSLSKLADGIKKIVRAEMAMMPDPDFQDYTFLIHFAPDITAGDGMEHFNSTQIVILGTLSGSTLSEAFEDAAHEFFHAWNVKRLRPSALGPFDYTRENYTESLWFVEGITCYYADLNLLRSGLRSRQEFLNRLAGEIRTLENDPGHALMSAESSSFHAWFYDRSPQMQETNFANTTISYYNKGAVLGLLLDLEIRSRTQGRKSLDDVLRSLYEKFYRVPAASYYGPGQGYEEKDVLDCLNVVANSDLTTLFDRYVRGTEPLPYPQTLALAGLQLRISTENGAAPSLGVLTQPADTGIRIVAVKPGGGADRGGLSRDDVLIAVDEFSLATEELKDRLKIYPAGAEVPFTVQRHGRRERISVKLDPPAADQYTIEPLPGATPEQVSIREGWLGNP